MLGPSVNDAFESKYVRPRPLFRGLRRDDAKRVTSCARGRTTRLRSRSADEPTALAAGTAQRQARRPAGSCKRRHGAPATRGGQATRREGDGGGCREGDLRARRESDGGRSREVNLRARREGDGGRSEAGLGARSQAEAEGRSEDGRPRARRPAAQGATRRLRRADLATAGPRKLGCRGPDQHDDPGRRRARANRHDRRAPDPAVDDRPAAQTLNISRKTRRANKRCNLPPVCRVRERQRS